MVPTISIDLKQCIVNLYCTGHWSMQEIAGTLKVSKGLISKVANIYHDYGTMVNPTKQHTGHPPYFNDDDYVFLQQMLATNNTFHLDKIQDRLAKPHNLHISATTISQVLQNKGMS